MNNTKRVYRPKFFKYFHKLYYVLGNQPSGSKIPEIVKIVFQKYLLY